MFDRITSSSAYRQLAEAAKGDPKKFGMLGVLCLVFVITSGRMVLTGSTGPKSAKASLTGTSGSAGGQVKALNGHNSSGASDKSATDSSTALPDPARPELLEWSRGPIPPVGRNLFAIKLDYYPQDQTKVDQTLRIPGGDGFWDKVAKSMASKADQHKERQILIENLQLQAMQIKLQSTVMGATPRALVNGSVVREGDVIASFRVFRIEARRIIVEREGIKLEIPMK
jgi:hypothetical protein